MLSFLDKNTVHIMMNGAAFESSTKFCFPSSYDLKQQNYHDTAPLIRKTGGKGPANDDITCLNKCDQFWTRCYNDTG